MRFHVGQNLTREKLYVLNNIYLGFSGLILAEKESKPFTDMFSATSCEVLDYFDSIEQIINTPIDELTDFISKAGKNRFKNPCNNANKLAKAARASYRLDTISYDSINTAIASSISIIKCLEKEIKTLDKAILETIKGLAPNEFNILISIRGIGPVYAADILAEIGSIDFFDNDGSLAKYADLYWNRSQSGNTEKEDKKFSRHSNKYLRYYIIEATESCLKFGFPFIANYYHKKYDEVTKHQHNKCTRFIWQKVD